MGKMNPNFKNKFNNKYKPAPFKKGTINKPNNRFSNNNNKSWNKKPNSKINPQVDCTQAERKEFAIKAGYKKLLRKEQRKGGPNEHTVSKTEEVQLNEAPLSTTSNWTVTVNKDNNNKDNHKPFLNKEKEKGKGKPGKPSALKKAQNEYQRKKDQEKERKAELTRIRKEKELAVKSRKQQRLEKYKILNQKTPKNQPVMKGRIQLLLNKIQSSLS